MTGESAGMTKDAGNCSVGYYCTSGSYLFQPANVNFGGLCPPGHFCPSGTSLPQQCPLGTYLPSYLGSSVKSCLPCPGGYHCNATGLANPYGKCNAGYYCISGAKSPRPSPDGPLLLVICSNDADSCYPCVRCNWRFLPSVVLLSDWQLVAAAVQ